MVEIKNTRDDIILDVLISGFKPGEITLIAGRPSTGKTQLAINIALDSIKRDKNVVFFTLELSKEQLVSKMLTTVSGIKAEKMKTGNISKDEWDVIVRSADELGKSKFIICNEPGISSNVLAKHCHNLPNDKKPDLIIIDYLQIMRGNGESKIRIDECSEIAKSLHELSTEYGIPIIVIAQLSKYYKKDDGTIDLKSSYIESESWDNIIVLDFEKMKGDDML